MTDRLKQIWSGFEGVTERHLTGRGIDNIVPPQLSRIDEPSRAMYADSVQSQEAPAPAATAFEALRTRLAAQEAAARTKKRSSLVEERIAYEMSQIEADEASSSMNSMLQGIKSTEERTMRISQSYATHVSEAAGRELDSRKKRKKFLGIF